MYKTQTLGVKHQWEVLSKNYELHKHAHLMSTISIKILKQFSNIVSAFCALFGS